MAAALRPSGAGLPFGVAPTRHAPLVLRANRFWRGALLALAVISPISAVAQQEWPAVPGSLLWIPLAAYAWRCRIEVGTGTVRILRLKDRTFLLGRLDRAAQVRVGVRFPYRALELGWPEGSARLLRVWWAGWLELAELVGAVDEP
jgi:hypothetical protein